MKITLPFADLFGFSDDTPEQERTFKGSLSDTPAKPELQTPQREVRIERAQSAVGLSSLAMAEDESSRAASLSLVSISTNVFGEAADIEVSPAVLDRQLVEAATVKRMAEHGDYGIVFRREAPQVNHLDQLQQDVSSNTIVETPETPTPIVPESNSTDVAGLTAIAKELATNVNPEEFTIAA